MIGFIITKFIEEQCPSEYRNNCAYYLHVSYKDNCFFMKTNKEVEELYQSVHQDITVNFDGLDLRDPQTIVCVG